jgi:hypothetical protein
MSECKTTEANGPNKRKCPRCRGVGAIMGSTFHESYRPDPNTPYNCPECNGHKYVLILDTEEDLTPILDKDNQKLRTLPTEPTLEFTLQTCSI